jgi:hypothetical protein
MARMANDPTVIWQGSKGEFRWLHDCDDEVAEAVTDIAHAMRGSTDEEIDFAINSYLAGLVIARKASLH